MLEKALYQAPMGLEQISEAEGIEIEIENPDDVTLYADGLEIDLMPEEDEIGFDANLADYIDEGTLQSLAGDLIDDFDKDIMDRKEWASTYVDGLKLLGLRYEQRTEPWNGACGVFHPMLTESVVRFQSEGITETFPAAGPVKTTIIGKETPEVEKAAARVRADMNYQLTDVMFEYRPEHEKLLWNLPITGSAFKKVYYDPSVGRQKAVFIPAEDIVVPYGESEIESSPRVTHVMRKNPNEIARLIEAGFYRDIELGEPVQEMDDIEKQKSEEMGIRAIQDDRFRVLEMHVQIDLPGFEHTNKKGKLTGIALPYVVTLEKGTRKILAIRRNWYEEDELRTKRQHFVHYQYIPGFGFYGYGLIHLIGGYAKSATMIMRQLIDAGTLSNLPGGLKTKGLRIKGDDTPISPGEFRDVDVPGGTIRDNILPLPYKEPSQVLYTLFNQIVEEGRAFASAGDMKVSDMSGEAPVGTTLAILERTLKVMGAVQARMHFSMKQEFKLLKVIIADYTPDEYGYEPETGGRKAKRSDYDLVDVIPVSDPNAATMAQKIVQYQAVFQLAQSAPQYYDMPLLHRQMIEILGIKNAAKLVPMEEDMVPLDPITENQNLLTGKPVKAFIEQNHQAHVQVHMSAIQNPRIQQLMQMNPMAQQIMAAAMAHINEHVALEYRRQVEEEMGILIPQHADDDEPIQVPKDVAEQIAIKAAQASQQITQRDQQQAKQAQAQQQMQDPVIQMQMQELQLKQQDLQLKMQKQQIEAANKADQLRIEEARIAAQKEIAAMQVSATAQAAKDKLNQQMELDGARLGVEIAKNKSQANQQRFKQPNTKEKT